MENAPVGSELSVEGFYMKEVYGSTRPGGRPILEVDPYQSMEGRRKQRLYLKVCLQFRLDSYGHLKGRHETGPYRGPSCGECTIGKANGSYTHF